jgi:hypothetical protein
MMRPANAFESNSEQSRRLFSLAPKDTISTLEKPIDLKNWQSVEKAGYRFYVKGLSVFALPSVRIKRKGYTPSYKSIASYPAYKPQIEEQPLSTTYDVPPTGVTTYTNSQLLATSADDQDTTTTILPELLKLRYNAPFVKRTLAYAPLRATPELGSFDIAWLPKGTAVRILGRESEMYKAVANGKVGFIHFVHIDGDYKTFAAQNHPYTLITNRLLLSTSDTLLTAPPDSATWYGRGDSKTPLRIEPDPTGKVVVIIPKGATFKIKRYNSTHWRAEFNGMVGYISTPYVTETSIQDSPFVARVYTGPTYDPDLPSTIYTTRRSSGYSTPGSTMYSTPTTGATIYTGPRGGKYYYNSRGNKTYVKHKR